MPLNCPFKIVNYLLWIFTLIRKNVYVCAQANASVYTLSINSQAGRAAVPCWAVSVSMLQFSAEFS